MPAQVEWFVECSVAANEIVALFLLEQGTCEEESKCANQWCDDGKRRNVWRITPSHIKPLREMLKNFPHAKIAFFKRETPAGPLRSASFLTKKRASSKVRRAKKVLDKHVV